MTLRAWRSKLTDAQVREILRSGMDITSRSLAQRYGVTDYAVHVIRNRKSFRAIRIAESLGIVRADAPRTVWGSSGAPVVIDPTLAGGHR